MGNTKPMFIAFDGEYKSFWYNHIIISFVPLLIIEKNNVCLVGVITCFTWRFVDTSGPYTDIIIK